MEVLGIDFGGSGIKGGITNIKTGEMIGDRYRLPTPELAKPLDVAQVVKEIVAHFGWKGALGFGFPGVVIRGITLTAANVDSTWVDVNAKKLLTDITGCSSYIVNDADAAGLAEISFGAGKGQKGVTLMLTLGTGIGSAIFTDGILVPNTEFGHLKIRGKDAEWRASDAARKRKDLSWEEWAVRLQEYLTVMEGLFWPDLIIVGGGVSKKSDRFLPLLKTRAKLVPAQMLNEAGIIGAAVYAALEMNSEK